MIDLSDQEILSRLTNFEDAFVERKSTGDMQDLLKTAVAFANSTWFHNETSTSHCRLPCKDLSDFASEK